MFDIIGVACEVMVHIPAPDETFTAIRGISQAGHLRFELRSRLAQDIRKPPRYGHSRCLGNVQEINAVSTIIRRWALL
jgi:hypothetical protein